MLRMRGGRWPVLTGAVLGLTPLALYRLLYDRFPDEVPIHYNMSGVADRFVSKDSPELLLLSLLGEVGILIMLLIYAVVIRRMFRDPGYRDRLPAAVRIWSLATLLVSAVFTGIAVSVLVSML